MIKSALCFLAPLVIAAAIVTTVRYAAADDAGHALIEPLHDAGLQDAGSASAPASGPALELPPAVCRGNVRNEAGAIVGSYVVDCSAPTRDLTLSGFQPTPRCSIDSAWELVEQHGPIWGGMLLLFGAVTVFLKRNEKERWIGQGRKLAIIVSGAGLLGSILEAGVGGGTWAGVIVTAVAAWKLMITPTTGPQPAKA